jgi:hypothetical protein
MLTQGVEPSQQLPTNNDLPTQLGTPINGIVSKAQVQRSEKQSTTTMPKEPVVPTSEGSTTISEHSSAGGTPTMAYEAEQAEHSIPIKRRAHFVRRHKKKSIVAIVLVALVSALICDLLVKPCEFSESQAETQRRLVCELVDFTPDEQAAARNMSAIPGVFPFCTLLPSQDDKIDLMFDQARQVCVWSSDCTSVFLSNFIDWIAVNPGSGALVSGLVDWLVGDSTLLFSAD